MFLRSYVKTELATPHGADRTKKQKKRSVSKMKVQVVTISSVQKSSKSELSSKGKRPFKVCSKKPVSQTLIMKASINGNDEEESNMKSNQDKIML